MNGKRIAALGVMSGTLITLLARASTSVAPPAVPVPTGRAPALTAPIFPEVDRLRERMRAPIGPATPTRNLFAFRRDMRRVPVAVAAPPAPAVAAPTAVDLLTRPPALSFVGLAEDASLDGPVRTAILSSGRDLHFVKTGDVVGGYRVLAIGADALELVPVDAGPSLILTLK